MAADDLQKQREELERLRRDYEKLTKKPAPLFNTDNIKNTQAAIEAMSDALEEAKDRAAELSEGFKGIEAELNGILDELVKGNSAIALAKKSLLAVRDIAQKLKYDQAGITELNRKQLLIQQDKLKIQQQELKDQAERLQNEYKSGAQARFNNLQKEIGAKKAKEQMKQEMAFLAFAEDEFAAVERTNRALNQRILKEERIEELMGLGGATLKSVEQTLSKIGLGGLASALGLDEALDKMRQLAKEIEEASGATLSFADKVKVLRAGFEEMKDQLAESLTDPLALGTFFAIQISDAILSLDKSTGELAKNFGISYDMAAGLSSELNTAANASYLLNVTTQGLTEAFITLNNQFGTFAQISEEALITFTRLTKEAGLSAESAGMLFRTTVLTGKEVEATTTEFLGEASALAATNGIALNQKQILEEVKNTSQATLLSLGGQPAKIAEAIVQAKLLGVNLQQVEGIAQSLLQFESSISSELEAELLTGKQLNLERARLAAINNDLATVAEEIAKQVGTAADFTEMNVIQQEALAKSVGMTREDLAKSLIEREALVKLSGVEGKTAQERFNNLVKEVGLEEAKKRLGDETLANQLAGQSVQERFTASIEKLKEVFVSLAEPLMPVLDLFAQIAEIVAPLAGVIGQILKFTVQLGKPLFYIFGIYKGIQAAQAANIAISRVAAIIEAGRLTTLQRAVIARGEENAISKISIFLARTKLFFTNAEYRAQVLNNAQIAIGNALTKIGNAFKRGGLIYTIGEAAVNAISKTMAFLGRILGPFAIPAAIAAGAAISMAGYKYLKGNDVVSGGYGKRTLLAPEGAIQLNDKDTVIAGTDLGGGTPTPSGGGSVLGGKTPTPSGGGSVNIAPLVAELQAIKTLLNTVLTKEGTISINGATVATAIYPDIQRISRLKDFKTQ